MRITALAGGVGGGKLLAGIQRALSFTRPPDRPWHDPDSLTAVVNTGDDARIYGVHVSPDVDVVLYWLAGIVDTERGWGVHGDAFTVVDNLSALGAETWFRLGDRDLATCLYRTQRLASGDALSAITDDVRRALGVRARVVPMSDDPVQTEITTAGGDRLDFQEYFVKLGHEPEVAAVAFHGAERARPAPGVLDAIALADAVVVCPSNPIVSIGPILAVPGIRSALARHPKVVAVSPIVGGKALKGPADRMLDALGYGSSSASIARLYSDFCDKIVIDVIDRDDLRAIEGLGMQAAAVDTVMTDAASAESLARAVLGMGP